MARSDNATTMSLSSTPNSSSCAISTFSSHSSRGRPSSSEMQATNLLIDGMLMDSATIACQLREAKNRRQYTELTLRNVAIDDTVARAAEDLFRLEQEPSQERGQGGGGSIQAKDHASVTNSSESDNPGTDETVVGNVRCNTDDKSRVQRSSRRWMKLDTIYCTGDIARVVKASIVSIQQFSFTGITPMAHNPRFSLDFQSLQALGQAISPKETSVPPSSSNRLRMLSLKGTRLTSSGLRALCCGLAQSPILETFQMSECALLVDEVAEEKEDDDVNDNNNGVGNDNDNDNHNGNDRQVALILADAIRKNKALRNFSLTHCKFGYNHQHQHPQPTQNDIDHVSPSHDQLAILLESLTAHPNLRSLNVFGMYCNDRSLRALGCLLRNTKSNFLHLGLKNNLRHPEDILDLTQLLASLEQNSTLEYLQLSGNNVNDDDMEQLSIILTKNSTLRALSLPGNAIGDDGVLSFAKRLKFMRGLRYLDVQRNNITDRSKRPIVQALDRNLELERLDLDGTWDAAKAHYLSLNRGGRRLVLSPSNKVPLSLWPLVLERANSLIFGRNQPYANLNVLYCLIRQAPALFQRRPPIDPGPSKASNGRTSGHVRPANTSKPRTLSGRRRERDNSPMRDGSRGVYGWPRSKRRRFGTI